MSCTFKCAVAFVLGAAAGSMAAWKLLETKYSQLAQEEIDSVKEVFAKRESKTESEQVENTQEVKDPAYDRVIRDYNKYSTPRITETEKEEERKTMDGPYVIPPSDFGEFDDYETVSLTYYEDHVLTDEDDELVEDIDDVVGFDSLNAFGEHEDDCVHVRNDRLKCDYEILRDYRKYSDVIKKPHQMED